MPSDRRKVHKNLRKTLENPEIKTPLVHRRRKSNYQCDICKKVFASSSNFKRHRYVHTQNKPHACGICGKTFIDPSSLRRHNRTHSGEKPYSCKICKRNFSASSDLKRHIGIHNEKKPLQCDYCEKSFRRRISLELHKRGVHFNEKPFKCEICGKGFVSYYGCKKHVRLHNREKPYRPRKSYSRPVILVDDGKHRSQKTSFRKSPRINGRLAWSTPTTNVISFECFSCGKAFKRKTNLIKHIRIHFPFDAAPKKGVIQLENDNDGIFEDIENCLEGNSEAIDIEAVKIEHDDLGFTTEKAIENTDEELSEMELLKVENEEQNETVESDLYQRQYDFLTAEAQKLSNQIRFIEEVQKRISVVHNLQSMMLNIESKYDPDPIIQWEIQYANDVNLGDGVNMKAENKEDIFDYLLNIPYKNLFVSEFKENLIQMLDAKYLEVEEYGWKYFNR